MTEFEIISLVKDVDIDVTFQMKFTLLNVEWQTLNMEAKPKIGQNQKLAGHIFWFLKFVNLDM
jgi:hypothetical protein